MIKILTLKGNKTQAERLLEVEKLNSFTQRYNENNYKQEQEDENIKINKKTKQEKEN